MRKALALLLLIVLCWFSGQGAPFLHAQEEDDDDDPPYNDGVPVEDDWDGYISDLYSSGDKSFTIPFGLIFPFGFLNNGKSIDHNFSPPVGGSIGPLSYNYFFTPNLFVGGEIAFLFNGTLANNTVFLVPIALRGGWQFVLRRFEFPLYAAIGIAPQRYLNFNYIGFFMKAGAGAFYRFNPDWSFGVNADWNWYPQRPMENGKPATSKNVDGFFIGLIIAARYHF